MTLENSKKNLALKDIGNNNQTKARKSLHLSTNNEKNLTTTPLNVATETTSNTREDTSSSNASKSKLSNKSTTTGTSNNNNSPSLKPIVSVNLNNSLNISHTINDDFEGDEQQKTIKGNKENTNLQQTSRVSDRRKSVTKTDPLLPPALTHLIDESNTIMFLQISLGDEVWRLV